MKLLAIDTSTEACSAYLLIDTEITTEYRVAPREHSRLILKMIERLLADSSMAVSDLDAIAFGCGPGSFMGLRIAAGVVQGIAFAHDIPVIGISTLKAIAQHAHDETSQSNILVAIDARMDEVYWCPYTLKENGSGSKYWHKLVDECVISPDNISLDDLLQGSGELSFQDSWVAAGTGWGSYAERILRPGKFVPAIMLDSCLPSSENIARLAADEFAAGNTLSAAQAIPVYLRNDVAKKPKPVVL